METPMKKAIAGVCSLFVVAAGCASTEPQKAATTAVSITTVEQELSRAQEHLDNCVALLGSLIDSPAPNFADASGKYVSALILLDERVYVLRDRATLMDVHRDDYLQYWMEQNSKIQDPVLRKQAEERRAQLMDSYLELTARGATLKKTYAPLHASLHDCERFLAADPSGTQAKGLASELKKIRQGQKEVDAVAKEYRESLKVIVDKLSVSAPSPQPGK
jgi:hypothetical protein